jgi:hypothetical protein
MSWFSLGNLFGSLGFHDAPASDQNAGAIAAQTDAVREQTASAKASADAALAAQKQANMLAASASVPAVDSESSRAAADDQKRKLLQGSSFGIGLPTATGAPPVGFRLLAGQ